MKKGSILAVWAHFAFQKSDKVSLKDNSIRTAVQLGLVMSSFSSVSLILYIKSSFHMLNTVDYALSSGHLNVNYSK